MGAPHSCTHPGCTKKFDRKYNLKCHLRIHSNEKPYRCTHAHCNRRFRWKSSLNHHLLSLDHTTRQERQARLHRRQQIRAVSSAKAPDHHPSPRQIQRRQVQHLRTQHHQQQPCQSQQSHVSTPPSTPPPTTFLPNTPPIERHDSATQLSFEFTPCRVDGLPSPVGILPCPTEEVTDPFRSQHPMRSSPPLLSVFEDGAMAAPQLDALYQLLF
ncbi:unnamed protein product [Agarophyton chilense]